VDVNDAAVPGDVPETVLLLLEGERAPLPFSTAGFTVSDGGKRKIAATYLRARVLFRSGTVRRIEAIEFLGYYGSTLLRRMFSAANGGTRHIRVQFSELPTPFDTIKRDLIARLQTGDQRQNDDLGVPKSLPEMLRALERASNMEDVFDALDVPAPSDTLDSMV
jgi:hypothetical protein